MGLFVCDAENDTEKLPVCADTSMSINHAACLKRSWQKHNVTQWPDEAVQRASSKDRSSAGRQSLL
jgi:hypothetical protein